MIAWLLLTCSAAPPAPPRLDRHGDPLPMHAAARLGTTRLRHPGGVAGVALTPDGKRGA